MRTLRDHRANADGKTDGVTGAARLSRLLDRAARLLSRRPRTADDHAAAAERDRREILPRPQESERRRAASERLTLVGRLAAGVGHEINNPLSAVRGNVTCALEELERLGVAPAAREALEEALAASERIGWVAADMRALCAEPGEPLGPCDVEEAIREGLARASGRLANATVQLRVEPELPLVRSAPRLLADAVAQLAAQAVALGSRAAGRGHPTIRIVASRVAEGVEIAIEDEGPRIPASVLPRIFEPFAAQGALRGAGLGLTLPLTRELAERSGGHVAASWHETGNRFSVTLAASPLRSPRS